MKTKLTLLLNDWWKKLDKLKGAQEGYFDTKESLRRYLNWENQRKTDKEEFIRNHNSDKDIKNSWKDKIPITMMKTKDLRRRKANNVSFFKKEINQKRSEVARARNEIEQYFDNRTVYFVTSFCEPYDSKSSMYESKCWGFFYDYKDAAQAVKQNLGNVDLEVYRYAVIEPKVQGLLSSKNYDGCTWFISDCKEVKGKMCYSNYRPCKEPEWVGQFHVSNWTMH